MWASRHATNQEANACEAAAVLVISDCPDECGGCTAAAAGCVVGSDLDLVFKRYEEVPESTLPQPLVGRQSVLAMAGVALVGGAVIATRVRGRARRGSYSDLLVEDDLPALVA